MRILAGVPIGFLLIAFLGGAVLLTGAFNTAATAPLGRLEERVASLVLDRSIQRRAPRMPNPIPASPDAAREGLSHFLSEEEQKLPAAGAEVAASHHHDGSGDGAPPEAGAPAASKPTPHEHSHH